MTEGKLPRVFAILVTTGICLAAQRAPHINELTTAIGAEDKAAVQRLIAAGVDVNGRDVRGDTPLIVAARVGGEELLRQLLEAGADPTARSKDGSTAVGAAAAIGDLHCLDALLDAVDEPEQMLVEALAVAASQGNLDVARAMLAAGADPGRPQSRSEPISGALRSGVIEMVELLLDHGANLHTPDEPGNAVIESAVLFGRADILAAILRRGADPNVGEIANRSAPLVGAVLRGYPECVRVLVAFGADARRSDADGTAILHVAAAGRHPSMIPLLVSLGADVDGTDADGKTPLWVAVDSGKSDAVRLLLEAKADASIADSTGQTPLDVARAVGRDDLIELLD